MSQKEPKHAFSSINFYLVNASTVATLKYRAIQQARLTLSHVYNEVTTEWQRTPFILESPLSKLGLPWWPKHKTFSGVNYKQNLRAFVIMHKYHIMEISSATQAFCIITS
jgi:hypothetical protein